MIILPYRVPYKYGQTIKIKPLFDVHLGNKYCDKKAFLKYLADSDDLTYFIGGGDMLDSITVTDWRYEKHADDTKTDAVVDEQVKAMVDILEPYKDKIIGLGRGNHEKTIIKKCGTDPAARVCEALGVPYLGYSWFIRFILHEDGSRARTIRIRGHHGYGGGGRTEGGEITKYWREANEWEADVFLYGHTHHLKADHKDRMAVAGNTLIARPKHLALCGTYLRTFSETTDSTYSEEAGYKPSSIGGVTVHIQPDSSWAKVWISTK